MRDKKIYLGGGIRSNWQDKVIRSVEATFFNPRTKEVDKVLSLEEFGAWDLHHIKMCDIFFAYMERTNPSGIGLAVEIGYAKAMGKTVILCLEEGNENIKDSYLAFLKKASDITFTDFDKAIIYLKLF